MNRLRRPLPVRLAQRRCALVLFSAAALWAGAGTAADRYDGVAYDRAGRVVYRETHWRYADGAARARLVLYRCPDGRPFARKQLRWRDDNAAAPDFEFVDQRDGYREGLVSGAGVREVYWQPNRATAERREQVLLGPDAVVDAGFDSVVQRHWDELVAGRPVSAVFLIPGDFAAIPVVIRRAAAQPAAEPPPVETFSIALDRWYGFVAPAISVSYDRTDRWLRTFKGTVTVRDDDGGRQALRVEFPADAGTAPASGADIAEAAAAPLTGRCRES